MSILKNLHGIFRRLHKPYGKFSFVSKLRPNVSILDVGCGNNSSFWVKQILPDCTYTGIDVGDYNQTQPNVADRYITTPPEDFASEIAKNKGCFDAVISSHNLEHCDDRQATLLAMLDSLKDNGLIFLSFPSEKSVHFPSRGGTLCYYDDSTHKGAPPDFNAIIEVLKQHNFEIIFADKTYQPIIDWLTGWFFESKSKKRNWVLRGTRSYYGFDAMIWARKRGSGVKPE